MKLGVTARDWWKWAWRTPAAAAWSANDTVLVARRALLEDEVTVLGQVLRVDLEAISPLDMRSVLASLDSLTKSRLALYKEMRELDDRLGLSPKSLAALRWAIVPDEAASEEPTVDRVDDIEERTRALYAVEDVG